jgi:hypothetical protein
MTNCNRLYNSPMMQYLSPETKFHTICHLLVNCVNDQLSISGKGVFSLYDTALSEAPGSNRPPGQCAPITCTSRVNFTTRYPFTAKLKSGWNCASFPPTFSRGVIFNLYSPVVTLYTTRVQHSTILHPAHTVDLNVLYGSQNKQILFPYTALTVWFFVTETECLYCAVIIQVYLTVAFQRALKKLSISNRAC